MGYTSYNRIRAGIEAPNFSISRPVVSQAIGLGDIPRGRGGGSTPVAGNASSLGGPLAGSAAFTNDLIASAQRAKKPSQEPGKLGERIDAVDQKVRDWAFGPEDAVATHIAAAESTAAQPSGRHAFVNPRTGEAVTATRNSRSYPQYPDADGPLGSAGSPFGVTPSTFDGVGGAFSGV